MALRVGSAEILRVEEQRIALPLGALTDDQGFVAQSMAAMPIGFHDPATGTFQFCFQSWIIRVDGLTILVDPCNGNGRDRGAAFPFFNGLDTPYLERLEAAGAPAEAIDIVFCTHMHNDHCGWNTRAVDGRWVPTFPNATYVFAEREYARWATPAAHANDYNVSVFEECVKPVIDAGQAKIVGLPHRLSPGVTFEEAPGHTEGHAMMVVDSDGQQALFTGDACHHPVQIFRPELHLRGCDDLSTAIATRKRVFSRIARSEGFIFPAHFAEPHHGRITESAHGFIFHPGGAAFG